MSSTANGKNVNISSCTARPPVVEYGDNPIVLAVKLIVAFIVTLLLWFPTPSWVVRIILGNPF